MRNLRRAGIGAGLGVLTLVLAAPSASAHGTFGRATLTGFASLPAATFATGLPP